MEKIEKLKNLMSEYKLNRHEIASYLKCSKYTIDAWFRTKNTNGYREVPEILIEHLKLKLKK